MKYTWIYHGLVVRERDERHGWVKNAGFKLVVGKFIFRSKKIGASRKVSWWVRNFRPCHHRYRKLTKQGWKCKTDHRCL